MLYYLVMEESHDYSMKGVAYRAQQSRKYLFVIISDIVRIFNRANNSISLFFYIGI